MRKNALFFIFFSLLFLNVFTSLALADRNIEVVDTEITRAQLGLDRISVKQENNVLRNLNNGDHGHFKSDYSTALISLESKSLEVVNSNLTVYRSTAKFKVTLNMFTNTFWDDIATKTTPSGTWLKYRTYSINIDRKSVV